MIRPFGYYPGNAVGIEVKNLTNKILNLEMNPGTIFIPSDTGEQTLMVAKTQFLNLDKSAEKTFNVVAFCTEASDRCPSKTSSFELSKTKNPSLLKLGSFIDSLKTVDGNIIQHSIWCVTDSHSVSDVYNGDVKASKALRNYLCLLTGQKDPWYNTQRELSVDENNYIVSVAKEIKGELAFQSTVPVELQGCVKDSTGKVIYTNPNKTNCPAGRIRFEFKLKVEGWAPGNYTVVYTNNGAEVLSQPFSF